MKKRIVRCLILTIVSSCCLVLAVPTHAVETAGQEESPAVRQTRYPQAFSEPAAGWIAPEERIAQIRQLHKRLVSEAPGSVGAPLTVEVTPEDLRNLERRDEAEPSWLVGLVKEVDAPVRLAPIYIPEDTQLPSHSSAFGALRLGEGGFVWSGAVRSAGATALRLHIADLDLPVGAELYLYNRSGEAFGPYGRRGPGGRGDFWTNTVSGEEAILQLRYQGEDVAGARQAAGFRVVGVGHLTERFMTALAEEPVGSAGDVAAANSHCTIWPGVQNAGCVENVNCQLGTIPSEVWDSAANAVALFTWIKGLSIGVCSGGLIADKDAGSQEPYFLTASHCISNWAEALTVETYWRYRVDCGWHFCVTPDLLVWIPERLGSSVVVTSSTGDYTLLKLWCALWPLPCMPSGSTYLGWNATPVAVGSHLYRISHPKGAPQAYSEHQVNAVREEPNWMGGGYYIESSNELGATESGSSGSPVLNAAGQVVGQLSYGPADASAVCYPDGYSGDGSFAHYYCGVKPYLDPLNEDPRALCLDVSADADAKSCDAQLTVQDLDGGSFDPEGDPFTRTVDPPGPYHIGETPVTLTATGNCGESDSCVGMVSVRDVTPPVLGPVPDVGAECVSPLGTPVGVPEPTTKEYCSLPVELGSDAPALFPLGTTTVVFTARDAVGNQAMTSTKVTVVDTTPPVLGSVPNIEAECVSPLGTPVNVPEPTATDICSPTVELRNNAPALFASGTTTVVFTARDESGNEATTSTNVTVVDTKAPELALQTNKSVLWPPNHKMADIAIAVTASDSCSNVSLSATVSSNEPASGSGTGGKSPDWTEPVIDEQSGIIRLQLRAERAGAGDGRVYRITIIATDQSGNSTSGSVDIMVPHDQSSARSLSGATRYAIEVSE